MSSRALYHRVDSSQSGRESLGPWRTKRCEVSRANLSATGGALWYLQMCPRRSEKRGREKPKRIITGSLQLIRKTPFALLLSVN